MQLNDPEIQHILFLTHLTKQSLSAICYKEQSDMINLKVAGPLTIGGNKLSCMPIVGLCLAGLVSVSS